MAGLLNSMLLEDVAPSTEGEPSPEEVPENQDDLMVFMRDFENTKLSATQRLAALTELVKLIKE